MLARLAAVAMAVIALAALPVSADPFCSCTDKVPKYSNSEYIAYVNTAADASVETCYLACQNYASAGCNLAQFAPNGGTCTLWKMTYPGDGSFEEHKGAVYMSRGKCQSLGVNTTTSGSACTLYDPDLVAPVVDPVSQTTAGLVAQCPPRRRRISHDVL